MEEKIINPPIIVQISGISSKIKKPEKEAISAKTIASTLSVITYTNGISQISPTCFFESINMSKLPLLVKYGLFIIAMPITLLNVGELSLIHI